MGSVLFKSLGTLALCFALADSNIYARDEDTPGTSTRADAAKDQSIAGDASQRRKSTDMLNGAAANWRRVVNAALETLPKNPTQLTRDQQTAIEVLSLYRSEAACKPLMSIISIKATASLAPTDTQLSRQPIKEYLDDFPAAKTLAAIGMPSVRMILSELNFANDEPNDVRQQLFARIIEKVLGTTDAQEFLLSQKSLATEKGVRRINGIIKILRGPAPLDASKSACRKHLFQGDNQEIATPRRVG
jgi:hypothetical protein